MRPFLPFLSKLVADKGTSIEQNVAFGAHHLALDIFRPLHAAPRAPVILFLHGGAWVMGSRAEYHFVGTVLAARGYTTIIPDYRKFPKVRFPAFVEDAAAAYRWSAGTFAGAGHNRPIIVMGHSAGAHSAALLALDQRYLAGSPAPAALIGFSGPPMPWMPKPSWRHARFLPVPRPPTCARSILPGPMRHQPCSSTASSI